MIQDIFEMPFAFKKDISFSSTVPLILYNEGLRSEEYYWFGRPIDVANEEIAKYHRYKFLEYVGDLCVERVLVSEQPIDIRSDWSKSDIHIIPVYAKRYDLKHRTSKFDRYLMGCWELLENFSMCADHLETVHDKVIRHLCHWRDIPGLKKDEYFDKVITGKTNDNLGIFRATMECTDSNLNWDQDFYLKVLDNPNKTIQPDKVEDKTTMTILTPNLTLKNLDKIKTKSAGLWELGHITGNPGRLFDPNGSDVKLGFLNDYAKWKQIGILDSLIWSNLTDIYFDVTFTDQQSYTFKEIDFLNRYSGYHVDQHNFQKNPAIMTFCSDLIVSIAHCALNEIPSTTHHLERLRIQMNWWDEIFIEIYLDGQVYRYFYDTTITTLADPSILNAWD